MKTYYRVCDKTNIIFSIVDFIRRNIDLNKVTLFQMQLRNSVVPIIPCDLFTVKFDSIEYLFIYKEYLESNFTITDIIIETDNIVYILTISYSHTMNLSELNL